MVGVGLIIAEYTMAMSRCDNTTNNTRPSSRSATSRLLHPRLYPLTYAYPYEGAWCTTNGAERLKPQEWDSILTYSYILRRAVQPSLPKTFVSTSPGTDSPPQTHGRPMCVAERDSHVLSDKSDKPGTFTSKGENYFSSGCGRSGGDAGQGRLHPTGVGLRGLQGLRCVPPTDKKNRTGRGGLARRPSSAPARRQHANAGSEGRYLSRGGGQTTAREVAFTWGKGDSGRGICHTAPGVWGVEECKELQNGLVRWL